ncbi:hypothetical protein SNOG_06782 [Parastagonospora nodorum SN15]|uniref:Uncharacterized protein n=1 Tax=Phaeosphaeria nodorum (strain SN15 / ATCC MYA-4574 / FGSC 10173) TaxID=321614 RepID=Q0UN82_PHANO|nr:hypothetical protein SNOG_06782 [Parastagonospora nodorum SN15]EAT85433.1 hypothetical protein SNOG_06782 [Parastagonospora nodorum SN15]
MTQTTDEGQDETTAEWRSGAGVRVPSFNICDFAARRLALQGQQYKSQHYNINLF